MTEVTLTDFEKQAGQRAHHRALIMQILREKDGLTVQQIVKMEEELFGYTFLTDNRLRELRAKGWVRDVKGADGLQRWFRTEEAASNDREGS